MISPTAFKPDLERLDADDHQAFATINDGIRSDRLVPDFDRLLGQWLGRRFPDPAPWENDRAGADAFAN